MSGLKISKQVSKRTPTGNLPGIRKKTLSRVALENLAQKKEFIEKNNNQKMFRLSSEIRLARQNLKRVKAELVKLKITHEQGEKNLAEVIACAGGPVFFIDRKYRYLSFNQQHARVMKSLFGGTIQVGHNILEYHTNQEDRARARKNLDRALKGETVFAESYASKGSKSQRYFEITHYPFRDSNGKVKGVIVYARDITKLKKREEENQRISRTVKALSNSNQSMMRARGENEYMKEVCQNIEKDCGFAMVWIGFAENDQEKTVRPIINAGFEDGYLENVKISWGNNALGRGPTGTAIRTGKVAMCRNMATDPKFKPWRRQAIKRGYASSIAIPLISGDKPFGAVTIYSTTPDSFTDDEVNLLSELVSDIAYGITAFKLRAEQVKAAEALRESESRYHTLFNTMNEGFALFEIIYNEKSLPADYRFLDINPAFERLTGINRPKIIGKKLSGIPQLLGEDTDTIEMFNKVAFNGEPAQFETFSPKFDRDFLLHAFQPEAGQFAVIFRDISSRKRMEKTQNWLATFPELNPSPVLEVDFKGVIQYINPNARKKFPDLESKGLEHPWMKGLKKIIKVYRNGSTETIIRDILIGSTYYRQTISCISANKTVRIYSTDITARAKAEAALREARDLLELRVKERTKELSSSNEQLQREISERKRAEVALLESERRYRILFDNSPDTVILIDLENKIIFANQQAATSHNYKDKKELVGMDINKLIASDDRERVHKQIITTLKYDSIREIEYKILTRDKMEFPAELNVSIVLDDQDEPIGFLMDIRDITQRKFIEESLRLTYAYNRSLIEASLDPLVTITPEGKIGDVNMATEVTTGYPREELIGTDFFTYFSDQEKARAGYQKVFETGAVRDYELEIRHKNGTITPVLYNASVYRDETGKIMGVFATARDITERKQFETQLIQAEKYAVVGRMVGSITHEINNPLQTIKNCLYLIKQDMAKEDPILEPLEMATSETLRLATLVGHLRELYRPKLGVQKESNDILDIIEEVHSLLVPHLNNAKVSWQPLAGLQRCYISCARDQILEVFLNISMNAIEAMQNTGGTLFVDMEMSKDHVDVIVKDTGPGISEEIAGHIFEPFMTTKESGLGLGLSISYGIVQRHGGQIRVENHPGEGAAFIIKFPLSILNSNEEESIHGNV